MSEGHHIVRGVILVLIAGAVLGWAVYRTIQRSDDPARALFKWLLTVAVVAGLLWIVRSLWSKTGGGLTADFGPAAVIAGSAAACGIILSLIWATGIATWFAKPLTSMYDGGDEPPEPRPAYSVARARKGRGKHLEAMAEVGKQLEKFPNDLEGILLLAEIQAENLHDLTGAEATVNGFCEAPGQSPKQIVAALNQLADWHLKLAGDRESARRTFERIISLFPGTEMAHQAAQRIAHLADPQLLLAARDRPQVHLPHGVQNIGLKGHAHLVPTGPDPTRLAADYVKQLESHPLDTEAREKLAVLYANHFGRLDLATDQLEQSIRLRRQSPKQVAHWLNWLADLQIKCGADCETAHATLQTIVDLYPQLAVADNARRRIEHLRLEFEGKEKSQAVKLGSYEQNLGLKMKR